MDAGTYGGSKAAKVLVKILEQEANPKYIRKVGNYYNEFTNVANDLIYSSLTAEHKTLLCQIWKEKCIKSVNDSQSITEEIKRFLCNIIVMKWRIADRFFRWQNAKQKQEARSKNVS